MKFIWKFFGFIRELFVIEIAIDLGTANTLILCENAMVDSPSIIALEIATKKVVAVGHEAKKMLGKTPDHIKVSRPLKDGVIADPLVAEIMIRSFFKKIPKLNRKFFSPSLKVVICIPSGITEVEKRAVKDLAQRLNAKEVYVIYEPIAAALGCDQNVGDSSGIFIVDIGGGTTECAVISLGGIVTQKSIKVAGDVLTSDIVYFMRSRYNLQVGESTAERIKIEVGSALENLENPPEDISIQGLDLVTGRPKEMKLSYKDAFYALDKSILRIEDAIMETLSSTLAELSSDIYKKGIYLAGGGANIRGLDKRIFEKTGLSVCIPNDPLKAVLRGTAKALKNIDQYSFLMK